MGSAIEKEAAITGVVMCEGASCDGKNAATALHTCPYKEEVNNDSNSLCNCCAECRQECDWAI